MIMNMSLQTCSFAKKVIRKENSRAINKFAKLIEIGNKVEEKLEKYKKEKKLQSHIYELFKLYKNFNINLGSTDSTGNFLAFDLEKNNISSINEENSFLSIGKILLDKDNDPDFKTEGNLFKVKKPEIQSKQEEINLIKAGRKLIMEKKIEHLKKVLKKINKKKNDTVNFCAKKIQLLSKEVSVFQNLDSSRLLFLIRKVRKLKEMLIEFMLDKEEEEEKC